MIVIVGAILALMVVMVLALIVGAVLAFVARRRYLQGRTSAAWVCGVISGVLLAIGFFLLGAAIHDYSGQGPPNETLKPPPGVPLVLEPELEPPASQP